MDKAQMVNVDAAAVMHNGQWLKISDRDEVQNLKSQNNNLQSQVNNLHNQVESLKPDVWLECNTTNTDTGKVLCNPYKNHVTGIVSLANVDPNNEKDGNVVNIYPPNGYKFNGDGTIYVSLSTKYQNFKMSTSNGFTEIWPKYSSNQYDPIGIDSFVDIQQL